MNPGDALSSHFTSIESQFVNIGLHNNKLKNGRRRHFNITNSELNYEKGIIFPKGYNEIKSNLSTYPEGFKSFFEAAEIRYSSRKWKNIVDAAFRSKAKPALVIPRADRTKHAIYLFPEKQVLVSTNFFCFCEPIDVRIDQAHHMKVIAAYLVSSFGQVQFEIHSNNQEGMRKLEGFHIEKIKSLDPNSLQDNEIDRICAAFDIYDSLGIDTSGREGIRSARRQLDKTIAEVLISHGANKFSNSDDFANYVELFLEELVTARAL